MSLFGRRTGQPVYGVVIDISSGSVGVAIVESKETESLPVTLYTYRTPLRLENETAKSRAGTTRKVRETLLAATLALSSEGFDVLRTHNPEAKITRMLLSCSSPWAYTVAKSVRHEAKEPFQVTKAVLSGLIREAEKEIFAQIREHKPVREKEFDAVERVTVDMTINDYAVRHPYAFKGTAVGFSHIVGLVPKAIVGFVHEAQDKLFPLAELKMHTSMMIIYCVVRDLFPKTDSVCIVNVTGDATEFGIVEDDVLVSNSHIAKGAYTVVSEIVEATGRPAADVYTHVQGSAGGRSLKPDSFEPFASAYIEQTVSHIRALMEDKTVPEQVVVIVRAPYLPLFKELIAKAVPEATGSTHTITAVDGGVVPEMKDLKAGSPDVHLVLAGRFFHKMHECTEMELGD